MTKVNETQKMKQISILKQTRLNKIFCILLVLNYLVYFIPAKPMYVTSYHMCLDGEEYQFFGGFG